MDMMDLIKKVFGSEIDESSENIHGVQSHDIRIAACSLFLEMANIDAEFSKDEWKRIIEILKNEYSLSAEHAVDLVNSAEKQLRDSLDLWYFTNQINENYSKEEKIRVVELLWQIIYTDGKMDKHEDYLVHKLARILRLSHSELIDTKLKVIKQKK
jgi:uncharacterized tellurite resistance protein B-like protein